MKNYLLNYFKFFLKRYVFILLTITISLIASTITKSAEENIFIVSDVEVNGVMDTNFSRDRLINKAFSNSFKTLMSRILLSKDLKKVNNFKLKQIKNLIDSFNILEESYSKVEYRVKIKVKYSDIKVKKFLGDKNIAFSQPEYVSAVFYPVLFINDEVQSFNKNFFYKNWLNTRINNELINFIMPLEDLDDLSRIIKMKTSVEKLDIKNFVKKYDIENYIFVLMDYQNPKLNLYLKANFNNNKITKNISYNVKNINDENNLSFILKDLKLKITDIWRAENLVNFSMPLLIKLKFKHNNLKNLDKLKNTFSSIGIIDNYTLEEFDINDSFFKIYYYGNPKKLRSELSKFGYMLMNNQGVWHLILNE